MTIIMKGKKAASSFRDPSGFVFWQDRFLYRQVNQIYKEDYDFLMNSGLYKELTKSGALIKHEETEGKGLEPDKAYKILKPEIIPFISYPYEWSFSQVKDAALLTLAIQKKSLNKGMSLKDASAYNIQFYKGKPVFIDILSFEKYKEGKPWVAYRQFCQHFLATLVLMSFRDVRLNQFLRTNIDGIPLDLTSSLLPPKTRFKFSLLSHIHLHAKTQKKYAGKKIKTQNRHLKKFALESLISNLESTVKSLKWQAEGTEWGRYYNDTNYSEDSLEHKKEIVEKFLNQINVKIAWDLGANTGVFSRISAKKGIYTVSSDIDPAAVEKNYQAIKTTQEKNILPLLIDLTNPSPAIGWENEERDSFLKRGPVDLVLALALIHHLTISNNTPLDKIAEFFSKACQYLIIEFIPKNDSNVERLLATREDIFSDYNKENFEKKFNQFFEIKERVDIKDSERTLYLMKKKKH